MGIIKSAHMQFKGQVEPIMSVKHVENSNKKNTSSTPTPLEEILKPLQECIGCHDQYQACVQEMRDVAKHFQGVHLAYEGAYQLLQKIEVNFEKVSEEFADLGSNET
jgi:hypothetical protein